MTGAPEITLEDIQYSGFFQGVTVLHAGYAEVRFVVCEDDFDNVLLTIKQQLPENKHTLHNAVQVARETLASTLEEIAKDIRTGARPVIPIELTEEELEEFLNEEDE